MRKLALLLVSAVAIAALAAPAAASAAKIGTRGVVVQRDARAGAVVLALGNGNLKRIKTAKPNSFKMGSLVRVSGTKLSVVGHARKAKLHGVVVRRSHGAFALAGNGSVLAVASTSPPAAGQQITTTVQVGQSQLSDDDGQVQVEDQQAPGAELRGTVLSQDAASIVLSVNGFPAGLTIGLGTQVIPVIPVGTPVEARVTLGPDPANPAGIILTLVSLHVESGGHGDHGSFVKAEGQVTALTEAGPAGGAPGSITIAGEHGDVTFVIPAGFGPSGATIGDKVEAKGTPGATATDPPTLVRLEVSGADNSGNQGDDDGGSGGNSGQGDGGSGGQD
jgi:uncharacterized membrane protein YgcG